MLHGECFKLRSYGVESLSSVGSFLMFKHSKQYQIQAVTKGACCLCLPREEKSEQMLDCRHELENMETELKRLQQEVRRLRR